MAAAAGLNELNLHLQLLCLITQKSLFWDLNCCANLFSRLSSTWLIMDFDESLRRRLIETGLRRRQKLEALKSLKFAQRSRPTRDSL